MSAGENYKWIMGAFPQAKKVTGSYELQFNCPKCGHDRFYFNYSKGVGHCFHASCEFSPGIQEMEFVIGYPPERNLGYVPEADNTKVEDKTYVEVQLPAGSKPLVSLIPNDRTGLPAGFVFRDRDACAVMHSRRISAFYAYQYNIQFNTNSVVVPVTENGKLVQFVQRFFRRNKETVAEALNVSHRYNYAQGQPITDFLLGWDKLSYHTGDLVLVENTFNAIWLDSWFNVPMKDVRVSTNFGSHLSDTQVDKIKKSTIRSVLLMWDEGAESKAEKAVKKLRHNGIAALAINIKGQPDDLELQSIKSYVETAKQQVKKGKTHLAI